MSLHIKVTQKNIDEGIAGMPRCCPIALAVREQVNDVCNVSVGATWINVTDNNNNYIRFTLPKEARDFVSSFDFDGEVHPFEFDAVEVEKGNWIIGG